MWTASRPAVSSELLSQRRDASRAGGLARVRHSFTAGEPRTTAMGSRSRPPVLSLAVAGAARIDRSVAVGRPVPRWHPDRTRRGDRSGHDRASRRATPRARLAGPLLAAVGHGRGRRHMVRAGGAPTAAPIGVGDATAGVVRCAAAVCRRAVGAIRGCPALAPFGGRRRRVVCHRARRQAPDRRSRRAARANGACLLVDRRCRPRSGHCRPVSSAAAARHGAPGDRHTRLVGCAGRHRLLPILR